MLPTSPQKLEKLLHYEKKTKGSETVKTAIMQPYFMPYLGYFQLIHAVDVFVLMDDVNFIKKGYIHRNSILHRGNAQRFVLPVEGMSQNKLILDLSFQLEEKTIKKLLSTMTQSYQKAPYFSQVFPLLEKMFWFPEKKLTPFIKHSLSLVMDYVGISTKVVVSSTLDKDHDKMRMDRLVEICNVFGADTYINPIGGRELYKPEDFSKENIGLYFLELKKTAIYPQFGEKFVPSLSMIDVLMFCSPEEIVALLEEYNLMEW